MVYEGETGPAPGASPGGQPQRTEQYADVIEMASHRFGQAARTVRQTAQRRPYLTAALVAAALGALAGAILAGRRPRRRRAVFADLPRLRARRAGRPGLGMPEPARGVASQAGAAAALVPLGMRLMANPLIRQAVFRAVARAMRGGRRR